MRPDAPKLPGVLSFAWLTPGHLFRYRGLLWSACVARKPGECWYSGRKFERGNIVFRPLTNAIGRARRICEEATR